MTQVVMLRCGARTVRRSVDAWSNRCCELQPRCARSRLRAAGERRLASATSYPFRYLAAPAAATPTRPAAGRALQPVVAASAPAAQRVAAAGRRAARQPGSRRQERRAAAGPRLHRHRRRHACLPTARSR
ncbi:MAG: hypothetical protein MZW92_63890 [Comamonadaceae bacterium]|nr:hypothetical protein [Comamonadaceae bacterium]